MNPSIVYYLFCRILEFFSEVTTQPTVSHTVRTEDITVRTNWKFDSFYFEVAIVLTIYFLHL